jgi:hypothetical protein
VRRLRVFSLLAAIAGLSCATPAAATTVQIGWSNGPVMGQRTMHFAAVAGNGKVVVGGGLFTSPLSSVQLYNPATDTWQAASSLWGGPRYGATATTLADGRVLVVGGRDSTGFLLAAEVYDPVANAWSFAGQLEKGRLYHTALRLPDGRVLVMGGLDGSGTVLARSEVYDPATNAWTNAGDGNPVFLAAAVVLANGRALVTGGTTPSGAVTSYTESWDPATRTWIKEGGMSTSRANHTATLLQDGRLLVTGGSNSQDAALKTAELRDPVTRQWSSAQPMSSARLGHTATLMRDGAVLVATGEYPQSGGSGLAEIYYPDSGYWSGYGMNTRRTDARAVLLADGRVLVVGGSGNLTATDTERFMAVTTMSVQSTVWDFGSVGVSSQGPTQELKVTNTGKQPLFISDVATSGVSASEFKIVAGGCGTVAIEPGATCPLRLRFAPGAVGQRRASVTFKYNAYSLPLFIDLKGIGSAAGVVPTPTPTPAATPEATADPQPSSPPPDEGVTIAPTPVATPRPKPAAKDAKIVFRNGYRVAARLRASSCRGKVSLELRRGKAVLAKRTTTLDGQCRFGATFTVGWGRIGNVKTLTVVAHFHGNRHFGATTNRFVVPVPKRG